MQQWAAVKTKFLWITVPPQILERSLSSLRNSSRTIQSQDSLTVIPFTTRRFLDLTILEFSSIEQYCRPSVKISVTGWKHGNLLFPVNSRILFLHIPLHYSRIASNKLVVVMKHMIRDIRSIVTNLLKWIVDMLFSMKIWLSPVRFRIQSLFLKMFV